VRHRLRGAADGFVLNHDESALPADRIAEVRVEETAGIVWRGRPVEAHAAVHYRTAETAQQRAFSAGSLLATVEDRYDEMPAGVMDWLVGVAVRADPVEEGDPATALRIRRAVRPRFPFRVGWTSVVGARTTVRGEVGYSLVAFPVRDYLEREFLRVNPWLPAERAVYARASATWAYRALAWGVEGQWRVASGLPVWVETEDGVETLGRGARAWLPVGAYARLWQGRAFVDGTLGEALRVRAAVTAESAASRSRAMAHIPYRPARRASADAIWRGVGPWGLTLGGEWLSSRYISPVAGAKLRPYMRIRGRLSRDLADAVSVFAAGETGIGDRREFQSALLPDLYPLAQHAVGVGIRAQF
jgi:hypothetical protein